MFCMLKKKKYILLMFQSITQIAKKIFILLMISNGIILQVKKLSTSLRRITYKHHGNFYCLNYLHSFAKEN